MHASLPGLYRERAQQEKRSSNSAIEESLSEYYRIPANSLDFIVSEIAVREIRFPRFGTGTNCHGSCEPGSIAKTAYTHLYDAPKYRDLNGCHVHLPFDPTEMIDNLRKKPYPTHFSFGQTGFTPHPLLRISS